MNRRVTIIATGALTGAALIAGCGGGAKPPAAPVAHQVSAPAACHDFDTWFLSNGRTSSPATTPRFSAEPSQSHQAGRYIKT
jgi:hypothetical protein